MKLGEHLIQAGLLAPAHLAAALEAQVVQGGRLGTNLVELGYLTEAHLAEALGRQLRVDFVFGDVQPDPTLLAKVPPKLAKDKQVVPLFVEAGRLKLAMVDPRDLGTVDAIAFRVGKRVVPHVMPEFRLHMLLRAHYGANMPIRAMELGLRRSAPVQVSLPSEPEPHAFVVEPVAMGEDHPKDWGRTGWTTQASAPMPPAPARPAAPLPPPPVAAPPRDDMVIFDDAPYGEEPVVEGEVVPELPPEPVVPPAQEEGLIELTAFDEDVVEAPAPVVDLSPLGFAAAQQALAGSDDRESVATTILRFARSKFRRVLLLSVRRGYVTGWRALGKGLDENQLKGLVVPLDAPSSFKLVCDTSSHFIGAVREPPDSNFFALLGGAPASAVMMPLLARGKVVHLLYVDRGPGVFTPPDLGELLILAQSVARSYEALIRARAGR